MKNSSRSADTKQTKTAPPEKNVDFDWGVKIPMRDGVHLNATIYKPKHTKPTPVIFTLTPYIADSYHPRAAYFAQQGYAFVLVDCCGCGNSEGEFDRTLVRHSDSQWHCSWQRRQTLP